MIGAPTTRAQPDGAGSSHREVVDTGEENAQPPVQEADVPSGDVQPAVLEVVDSRKPRLHRCRRGFPVLHGVTVGVHRQAGVLAGTFR